MGWLWGLMVDRERVTWIRLAETIKSLNEDYQKLYPTPTPQFYHQIEQHAELIFERLQKEDVDYPPLEEFLKRTCGKKRASKRAERFILITKASIALRYVG